MKKLVFVFTTVVTLAFSQMATAQKTIVDAAVGNENFSTLVAALKAADLVSALQGDGPFTVFAPTNDAFAKIDKATLSSLLKPENKETLTKILTYHVISGKLMASDVVAALKKGKGKVIANKPGHLINTQIAKKLSKIIKLEKRNNVLKLANERELLENEIEDSEFFIETLNTKINALRHSIKTRDWPKIL